jgi:hypothetical protein
MKTKALAVAALLTLALGVTYGADATGSPSDDIEGGLKVMSAPAPLPEQPCGAAVALADMFAEART